MLYLVDFCIVAFVFGIGGDSQSQTPSPKRMHSYKSSANAESFSESDGDDDRGEVASFYNKLTIIIINFNYWNSLCILSLRVLSKQVKSKTENALIWSICVCHLVDL